MSTSRIFLPLLVLAVLAAPATLLAQPTGSAAREAGKRRAEALAEKNKAVQGLNAVAMRIRGQFEGRQEWIEAENALRTAQRNYDAARNPLLDKVRGSDEYKKLSEQRDKAEAEVSRLQLRRAPQNEVMAAADKAAEFAASVAKLELEVNNDPKVQEARKHLNAAQQRVTELRMQVDEAMKSDPDWLAARKLVDDAETKLKVADEAVAQAAKAEAEAAKQRANSSRRSTGSRSTGRGY